MNWHKKYCRIVLMKYVRITFDSFPNELVDLIISMMKYPRFICGSSVTAIKYGGKTAQLGITPFLFDETFDKLMNTQCKHMEKLALTFNNYEVNNFIKINNRFKVKHVSFGANHTIFITHRNKTYSFGRNFHGQLGQKHNKDVTYPKRVLLNDVIKVKCGDAHSIFLISNGDVYTCGSNQNLQLGLDNIKGTNVPSKVKLSGIISINCARYVSVFLNKYGELYVTGHNHEKNPCGAHSGSIKLLSSNIVKVNCGNTFCVCLNNKLELYSFGYNSPSCPLGAGGRVVEPYHLPLSGDSLIKGRWEGETILWEN